MPLVEIVTDEHYRELILHIDRWLFGKRGSLARDIKDQGGRVGYAWDELSERYYDWKEFMMGEEIPGEKIPPKEVVSTDIWVRTGKMLEMVQTTGEGRFKTIKSYHGNFFNGAPFIEWYVEKLEYWVYANEKRPLFVFTDDDKHAISAIIHTWLGLIIEDHLTGKGDGEAA
jgi:hypothetical protein